MDNSNLKRIIAEQRNSFLETPLGVERTQLASIQKLISIPHALVITGLRRVGKSTFLAQIAKKYYPKGDFFYAYFEDERFLQFTVEDFEKLFLSQIELFGEQKCFFLDEIQNIKGWEIFVRRLFDKGYKVYVTGSNASLLSRELGTRLTGRYVALELYPFSFAEYLSLKNIKVGGRSKPLTTSEEATLLHYFHSYMDEGGIPEALLYPSSNAHQGIYNDVLYRDIIARYKVEQLKALKEVSSYLLSNVAKPFAYSKLRQLVALGSLNTVKNFVEYLENSWLFFIIHHYAFSIKKQQIAPKKIYSIDTGMVKSLGFYFSENTGRLFENIVFIELRKKYGELFYYKTKNDLEVDFLSRKKALFFQASLDFDNPEVRERELQGIVAAVKELGWGEGQIFTLSQEEKLEIEGVHISVLPLWLWIL